VHGHYLVNLPPSMILLGFGAGAAFNPLLLAAMGDVDPSEAGLASGMVHTSFMMGGALGLAVLASIAASRTTHLVAAGASHASALVGGYHVAFVIGAAFAALAAAVSAQMLRAGAIEAAEETVGGAASREPAFADASL
jgi:MFS family permease